VSRSNSLPINRAIADKVHRVAIEETATSDEQLDAFRKDSGEFVAITRNGCYARLAPGRHSWKGWQRQTATRDSTFLGQRSRHVDMLAGRDKEVRIPAGSVRSGSTNPRASKTGGSSATVRARCSGPDRSRQARGSCRRSPTCLASRITGPTLTFGTTV
jgi:hypothetical protein